MELEASSTFRENSLTHKQRDIVVRVFKRKKGLNNGGMMQELSLDQAIIDFKMVNGASM